MLLEKLHIDDPIEAVQVHGVSGLAGVVLLGFFHTKNGVFYWDPAVKGSNATRWELLGI